MIFRGCFLAYSRYRYDPCSLNGPNLILQSSSRSSTTSPLPAQHIGYTNNNGWETKATSSTSSRPDENTHVHTTTQTTTTYSPHRPPTPPSPPITFSEIPVSPSKSPVNLHPPGQTVADLLNSIGGGFSFPNSGPPPSIPTHPLLAPSNNPPPQTRAPPTLPPHPLLPPVPPPVPAHPLLSNHNSPSQAMRTPPPPPQVQAGPAPNTNPGQRPRERPPHLDAPPAVRGQNSAIPPGISQINGVILDTLPTTYRPTGPDPRAAFQRDLIDMIQRDPIFVDQLFQAYLARRS
jgi:hypothetical protein